MRSTSNRKSPRACAASTSADGRSLRWLMEAATPLRPTRVHALVGRLIVENVVVDDPIAAELVRRAIEEAAR